MKVQIRDERLLSSISVASLRSYLGVRGWTDDGPWGGGRATLYVKARAGRSWDLLVPSRDTVGDYASGMAETLEVLAAVEDRSQLDVYHDIMGAGADVIRLRSLNGREGEPLSLRGSARLYDDAYKMLASAARAVENPRAAYRGGYGAEVADYLDSVRPISGRSDGYSLVLHSPVPVEISSQEDLWGNAEPPPFARRASIKLASALSQAEESAAAAVANDTLEHFADAVKRGVSANLCDSVAELAKKGGGIAIDLDWARVRPSGLEPARFRFSETSASVLAEAGKFFRVSQPSYGERVTAAHVVALAREPHEFDGRAHLMALRDGRMERLESEFAESDYDEIIRAFRERAEISLTGDIFREGNGFALRNPRDLSFAG